MKYCVYCGYEMPENETICPFCNKENKKEKENIYKANIECIKCHSKNVEYQIHTITKKNILFEDKVYNCKDCNKHFRDKNRLGPSFNNYAIAISPKLSEFLTFIIIFFVVFSLMYNNLSSSKETVLDSQSTINCIGLTEINPDIIYNLAQEDKEKAKELYLNKSYIFTGTVFSTNLDRDEPYVQIQKENGIVSPRVYLSKEESIKLNGYKYNDPITICGTITKINSFINPVQIENGTLKN